MEYKIEDNSKINVKLISDGNELAKATCYYINTPMINEKNIGTIGEFEAQNKESGVNILKKCEELLKEKGIKKIVAPMNGNTWKQYRTLKYTNGDPLFILENVNSIEYNEILKEAGFVEIDTYTSTKGFISDYYDSEILDEIEKNLDNEKISIRKFEKNDYMRDLKKIYNVSLKSFCKNPFYTPIKEDDFLSQYLNYIQMVDEDFILIAEKDGKEIGFVFCIPDFNEMKQIGKLTTLILKTIAILPEYEEYAIGNIMLRKIAKIAQAKSFEKWVFAFMYSNNTSQKMAQRNKTKVIREYALYGKEI